MRAGAAADAATPEDATHEAGMWLSGNDQPNAWLSAAVAHVGVDLVSFDRALRIGNSNGA
jgi:hypothetical protein